MKTTFTPPLFVSHGAPTLALAPGQAGAMLARLGRDLPRPGAVLVVSAHWETPGATVSEAAWPRTIHDFYGFPGELYGLSYNAPGSPALAARVAGLLTGAGMGCATSPDRGLDHGAWVPLRYLYPAADVPVVQLSVSPGLGAAYHLALGRALAPLAHEGVLVLGSGALTHDLREVAWQAAEGEAPAWVREFADWVAAALATGDAGALAGYRRLAPNASRNHPTEEHYLPLLVAFGAAGPDARGERQDGSYTYGVLSMDAFVMSPAA